jgi:hypothetical protein
MPEQLHCMECGKSFDSRRSLHAHIKIHELTLGDYYVKYFPKFDLLTGDPIPFKDYASYMSTDFRHKKNMYKWLASVPKEEADYYCRNKFRKHMEDRQYKFAPSHLYFLTHPSLPKIGFFNQAWLDEDFASAGCKKVFTGKIDDCPDFENVPKEMEIAQDTREQNPLAFPNNRSFSLKLDFGDYTAMGEDYAYVFVDRKSEDDFKGTMSQGFDRFCRELDRAREFQSYVFVVIESNFKKIYQNNSLPFKKKSNLTYVWKNMREIIVGYSDVCQFVFTGSRENSSLVIPYLLKHGQEFRSVDLQFFMEKYQCLG